MKTNFLATLWTKLKQLIMLIFRKLTENAIRETVREVVAESNPSKQALVAVDSLSVVVDNGNDTELARVALLECVSQIVSGHETDNAVKKLFGLLAIVPSKILESVKSDVLYELCQLFERE